MAYGDHAILRDLNGNVIPQGWDESGDDYMPLLVDSFGRVLLGASSERIGKVTLRNAANAADIDPLSEATFAAVLGTLNDAAVAAGASGTQAAKLRLMTTQLQSIITALGLNLPTTTFSAVNGAAADAAVITDTTGTLSGKLRGLVKWAYERMPAALGVATAAASLPMVLASDHASVPTHRTTGVAISGGWGVHTRLMTASTNAVNVKGSQGSVGFVTFFAFEECYFRLYNKATAPTPGTDTPVWAMQFEAGDKGSFIFGDEGMDAFDLGIGMDCTGALGASAKDNTSMSASGALVSVGYY